MMFHKIRTTRQLCTLLKVEPLKLTAMSLLPQYDTYFIAKKKGGKRLIEDPDDDLKEVLRSLNEQLQVAYHALRPDCVHGFCISTKYEEDRNIVSNANRHLGKPYMLNIDFKDFFHTIRFEKVYQIFQQHFPKMEKDLVLLLTKLCTYKDRLPMGSPTSPVLSNFACLDFDAELMRYYNIGSPLPWQRATNADITYTRFADDLCFSSHIPITENDIAFIRSIITYHGFEVNENKVHLFAPEEDKIVTGIVVGETALTLPATYLQQLATEIERYKQVMLVESRYQTGMSLKKLNRFKQEIQSKCNFAEMVMGKQAEMQAIKSQLEDALNPLEDFESENWLELPYNVF